MHLEKQAKMHRENTHTEKKGRPLCIYKSIYNKKEERTEEEKRREEKIYMYIYILYDSVYDTDHNTHPYPQEGFRSDGF
jgi:hypothetical protein